MSRNFWIGLVSSVVVVALAVGGLVLARELGGPDLTLPDEVGGIPASDSDEVLDRIDGDRRAEVRERNQAQLDYNQREFGEALDGAEVVVRTYVDVETDDGPSSITVVAADTNMGPLLPEGGFPDPEASGFAAPLIERVVDGDVECLVRRNNPPSADDEDVTEEELAPSSVFCQRADGSLTVRVGAGSGATVDGVMAFVDDVYDELG